MWMKRAAAGRPFLNYEERNKIPEYYIEETHKILKYDNGEKHII